MPRSTGLLSVPTAATIITQAYTRRDLYAALSWPLVALSLLPLAAVRGLYLSADRLGAVVVHRKRLLPVVVTTQVGLILTACWIVYLGLMAIGADPVSAYIVGFGWFFLSGFAFLYGSIYARLARNRLTLRLAGSGGGAFWIGYLAQKPGTMWSALRMTEDVLRSLPDGASVHIACADELVPFYRSRGFSLVS